jgi:hypothetical protein
VAALGLGCFAHRPAIDLAGDAPVVVEFETPRTVALLGGPGDSLWLSDVSKLRGRVQRLTPDTLYLRASGAWTSTDSFRAVPSDRVIKVARRADVLIEGRDFQPVHTVGLVLGVVALLAAIGLAIAIATWETPG